MKKIFTLFAALTLAAVAYAQSFVSETNSQQAWWGYVTSMDGTGVGTRTAETYDCAIFIPGTASCATLYASSMLLSPRSSIAMSVFSNHPFSFRCAAKEVRKLVQSSLYSAAEVVVFRSLSRPVASS